MEVDWGTVEYWQTWTCNASHAIAYSYVKISAWRTSFGGHGGSDFCMGARPQASLRTAPGSRRWKASFTRRRSLVWTTKCSLGTISGSEINFGLKSSWNSVTDSSWNSAENDILNASRLVWNWIVPINLCLQIKFGFKFRFEHSLRAEQSLLNCTPASLCFSY